MSSCDDLGLCTDPLLDDAYGAVLTIRNREVLDFADMLLRDGLDLDSHADHTGVKIGDAQLLLRLLEDDAVDVILSPIRDEIRRLRAVKGVDCPPNVVVCYHLLDATLDNLWLINERPCTVKSMASEIRRVAPDAWPRLLEASAEEYKTVARRWAEVPFLTFGKSNIERHGVNLGKLGDIVDPDEFLTAWAKNAVGAVYANPDLCGEAFEQTLEQFGIDERAVAIDEQHLEEDIKHDPEPGTEQETLEK